MGLAVLPVSAMHLQSVKCSIQTQTDLVPAPFINSSDHMIEVNSFVAADLLPVPMWLLPVNSLQKHFQTEFESNQNLEPVDNSYQ